MEFIRIDIQTHKDLVLSFRRDAILVSFGSDEDFHPDQYLAWLKGEQANFPNGFMLLTENGLPIGQVELSVRKFDGRNIGYVYLFYLIPEKRGKGLGDLLHNYGMEFFKENNVDEYHLRVAPENHHALSFYRKKGLKMVREEPEDKVIRMAGTVTGIRKE